MRVVTALFVLAAVWACAAPFAEAAPDFCASLAGKSGQVIYPPNMPANYLNTTWETLYSFCQALPKFDTDVIYYHWSPLKDCVRWGVQGLINEGEMDFLTAPERGSSMYAGNGFYIAQGMSSSSNYGPCCTYVNIPAGTLKLDYSAAQRLFGITSVDSQKKVYLGRLVPFVHFYNGVGGDWTVTHSHIPLQNLQSGPRINAQDAKHADINFASIADSDWWQFFFGVLGDQNWVNSLWGSRSQMFRDALGYMQSLFTLIGYQDPISLMRSVIVNPNNPWGEFEPQNFEAYKKTLFTSANQIVNAWPNSAFGIANPSNGAFGIGDQNSWSLKMSQSVIPGIYQSMSGGASQSVRDGAVRAGGDQANNTFLATGSQVEAMQLNPFLYVDATPVPGATDLYYVSYFYPDATEPNHFMKLVNKTTLIPADVAAILRSGACCKGNNTQLLMTALMTQVMRNLWGKSVGAVPAAVSLVSIHPYYDYNDNGVVWTMRWFGSDADPHIGPNMDVSSYCASCGKAATQSCGVCKKVKYCTRECQVSHWKIHKSDCNKSTQERIENFDEYLNQFKDHVVVKNVANKGRGMFAAKTFQPGDVIFSERAILVSDLSSEDMNPLQKLVDLVLQVVFGRSKATLDVLLNLNGHESEAANMISKSVQNVLETLKNTPDYEGKKLMQPVSQENLKRLAQIFLSNTHGIEGNGVGLFLLSSMMNHECLVENCNFYTEGDKMYILAVKNIAAGDELTIDYRWSYSPVAERQDNLKESYGFTCNCRSCTSELDLTRPFVCPDGDCVGSVYPIGLGSDSENSSWKCSVCNKNPTLVQIKEFLSQEKLASAKVTDINSKQGFLSRRDCLLKDSHYIFFRAVDNEVATLFSRGIDPLPSLQYLVGCVERLIPDYHASRSTFYEMLGDAYQIQRKGVSEAKRKQSQKEAYTKALKVREISRGKDSLDVKRLRAKMAELGL